ncbi:hypothetical protein OKW11_000033 [Pseudomonas baetica]|nr:hypothetical protein [Pseudomonas baetica]
MKRIFGKLYVQVLIAVILGAIDRIFAHSAVEERSVLPDLKKASRV